MATQPISHELADGLDISDGPAGGALNWCLLDCGIDDPCPAARRQSAHAHAASALLGLASLIVAYAMAISAAI